MEHFLTRELPCPLLSGCFCIRRSGKRMLWQMQEPSCEIIERDASPMLSSPCRTELERAKAGSSGTKYWDPEILLYYTME